MKLYLNDTLIADLNLIKAVDPLNQELEELYLDVEVVREVPLLDFKDRQEIDKIEVVEDVAEPRTTIVITIK